MGATVLVVEDDAAMRLLCRVNLELEGYRVLEAPRVEQARELLSSEQIALVLLDFHVGNENGYGLVDLAREKKAAVAFITGSARIGPEERARADAVLTKPFKFPELMETVKRLTSG